VREGCNYSIGHLSPKKEMWSLEFSYPNAIKSQAIQRKEFLIYTNFPSGQKSLKSLIFTALGELIYFCEKKQIIISSENPKKKLVPWKMGENLIGAKNNSPKIGTVFLISKKRSRKKKKLRRKRKKILPKGSKKKKWKFYFIPRSIGIATS